MATQPVATLRPAVSPTGLTAGISAIDLFAGLGGFTEGAVQAGFEVVWAANHWPLAVRTHLSNHPDTLTRCQDLHLADWSAVPRHDVMLAAPCCQGHSHARGRDRPHHDSSRATAWAVVSCAEYHRPAAIVVENLPAFLNWILYPAWSGAMRALGYALSPHCLDTADHGVPQNRKRLFLICTRSRRKLTLTLPRRPHAPIGPHIQWEKYEWSAIHRADRSEATLARIRAARRQGLGDRFLIPYYGSGSGLTGRSLGRPLGTVTTRDRWAVIDGDRMRMLQPWCEYKAAMGFRADYQLPTARTPAIHLLGNAVCPPQAADILIALATAC
jgi:DNA (cytosine-5)-methyltransferase 1